MNFIFEYPYKILVFFFSSKIPKKNVFFNNKSPVLLKKPMHWFFFYKKPCIFQPCFKINQKSTNTKIINHQNVR